MYVYVHRSTSHYLRLLGLQSRRRAHRRLSVRGRGLHGLAEVREAPERVLDADVNEADQRLGLGVCEVGEL
jgi:hypothetical protein